MRSVVRTLVIAFTSGILAGPLAAQSGSVKGTVADSAGAPLSGAAVAIEGTGLRALTGPSGTYLITSVPAGSYAVRARLIGYTAVVARITVGRGESVTRDFTLSQSAVRLAPIDVVVGSRARHTAGEELAVPVDVFSAEVLAEQGTTETSQILQFLAPSVNFPRQSVTDATDIVRPFTLRGLSPDQTLVLVNGWRRHQTAVLNTFAYGTGAGSSGVDLNALPSSAVDRIEVLRDGASAQYGSDAIAGVVNLVLREGVFTPFINADVGRHVTSDYPDDGTTFDVGGGVGVKVGRGSLGLFAEYRDRNRTNRAWADPFDTSVTGEADSVSADGKVIVKRNPVLQPSSQWGDGDAKDIMTLANFRLPLDENGTKEIYAFGGYSHRRGTGNGFRRYADDSRNWPQIFEVGFLPQFNPSVNDFSAAAGFRAAFSGWSADIGASFGHNDFAYDLENTLNTSLGPCLDVACAPGLDGIPGTADDPTIPNQTQFFAGRLLRDELILSATTVKAFDVGLPGPLNLAFGAAFRRENYKITEGELASYIDGGSPDQDGGDAPGGSQVFPGFAPADVVDADRNNVGVFADAELNVTEKLLLNGAARYEHYSDFGGQLTGKLAGRFQPTRTLTLRGAVSTGFRAPGLSQVYFRKVITNFIFDATAGRPLPVEVGLFRVDDPVARLLGSQPLQEEKSLNISAGFAVTPTPNLTLTADYFYIKIDDRILLGATFDDDTTLAILARNGISGIGGVQYFTNGLDTKTQGVDFTANLRVPSGYAGRFDFTAAVNYTKNEITRVAPLPPILANSDEPGILDVVTTVAIQEERPAWRGTLTVTYARSRLNALVRGSYFDRFASAQPGYCDDCREEYAGKALFDAEVSYRFLPQLGVAIGARNIFDTYPGIASEQNSFLIYPWAAASPFGYNGRYVYARTEILLGR
jgi:iron complex outermembrane receptor protein